MDQSNLRKLLPLLQKHGVKLYKTHEIELHLELVPIKSTQSVQESGESVASSVNPESMTPNEFKGDDAMTFDQILNWSGSPDPQEIPLPLTGEVAPEVPGPSLLPEKPEGNLS